MLSIYEKKLGQWALQQPETIQIIIDSGIIIDKDLEDFLNIIKIKYKKEEKLPDIELYKRRYPSLEPIFENIDEVDITFLKEELREKSKENIGSYILDGMANGNLELEDIQKEWKKNVYEYEHKIENEAEVVDYKDIFSVLDDIENDTINKISTGYSNINSVLGGWRDSSVYCLMGLSGIGKSIFLANFAGRLWKNGKNILYITTEMNHKQTYDRIFRSQYDVTNISQLRKALVKEKSSKKKSWADHIKVVKVHPLDTSCNDIENIINELSWNVDALIIDYFDEIKSVEKSTSEYDKHGYVASEMKKLAEVIDVPIITATQTNRGAAGEFGGTKAYVGMESIADSSKKVRPLDVLFGIIQDPSHKEDGKYELSIVKNRYGISGGVPLDFTIDYNTMRIDDSIRSISKKEKKDNIIPSTIAGLNKQYKKNNIETALEKLDIIHKGKKK